MFRSWLLSTAVLLTAASAAAAGTTNLSGTVTTSVPVNFVDSSGLNGANATGPSNGTYMTIVNIVSGAFGTWTVSAGLGSAGINQQIALTFYVRSPNASNISAVLNRVQFTDTNGNTATFNNAGAGIGFNLSLPSNNTLTALTYNSLLQNYTLAGSFSAANAVSIAFDITFLTNGNNKLYQLDAVDVTTTPEPATVGLFALGAIWLGCLVRRRARKRTARRSG